MIFAAFLLIVVGTYNGDTVRVEITTQSEAICQAIERSVVQQLTWQARDVTTTGCRER